MKIRIKVCSDAMGALFVILLSPLFLCSTSLASEPEEIKTASIRELLLFYELDDLIEVSYRRPTEMKYVAENISIITAEEIAAMNAHSVFEVLSKTTGVFYTTNGNYGGTGDLSIQGSVFANVLVLLDGIRLNDPDTGIPLLAGIPVQIIDRIEVIKGPASSAWGSSLGGVINIITKGAGESERPSGELYGSYGEGSSQDYRADIAGKVGKFRYYAYGGYMDSDGLVDTKFFHNKSLYAKIALDITDNLSLTFTGGYTKPEFKYLDWQAADLRNLAFHEEYFFTGRLDANLSDSSKLNINIYYRKHDFTLRNEVLGTGMLGNAGDLYWDYISSTPTYGFSGSITSELGNHTVLVGAECTRDEIDRTIKYGPYFQVMSLPPTVELGTDSVDDWALYANDTMKLGRLSVTPGIRYDYLSISSGYSTDFISPSLGLTYKLTDMTLLRATASRGFRKPLISLVDPAPIFNGNPDLEPEEIWSFQTGIESVEFEQIHLKADLFYHHITDTWQFDRNKGFYVNMGEEDREGFELTVIVSPFENVTGSLGVAYVYVEPYGMENDELYSVNTKLRYNTDRTGSILLVGSYLRYSNTFRGEDPEYNDMIWDLHYSKSLFSTNKISTEILFSIRNLFNGSQYWDTGYKNPGRWIEAGIRIKF
jgi:vitamin B12 transporter